MKQPYIEGVVEVDRRKVSLGFLAAAVLLFLLPWVEVSCEGREMVTQSGLQAMYGGTTVARGPEDAMRADRGDEDDELGASLLVVIAFLAILGAGFSTWRALQGSPGDERRAHVLAVAAAGVLLFAGLIGFPIHGVVNDAMAESGDAGIVEVEIEATLQLAYYLTVLALLAASLPTLRVWFEKVGAGRRAAAAGQAAPSPAVGAPGAPGAATPPPPRTDETTGV